MRIFRKFLVFGFCFVLLCPLVFLMAGCKVDYWEESDVYSCYYYGVDGVDLTSEIVSYTLELRGDGALITRYKTKKNSDSGKDEYYIDGDYLVVSAYYGKKKYDLVGNEIIIGDYVDANFVLAKFRLAKSIRETDADMYSCTNRKTDGEDVTANMRYQIAAFYEDGGFALWLRDKEQRLKFEGTYEQTEDGYLATENETTDEEGNILPPKQWEFEQTPVGLTLREEGDKTTISKFEKTQTKGETLQTII